jgi:hypothetical protein
VQNLSLYPKKFHWELCDFHNRSNPGSQIQPAQSGKSTDSTTQATNDLTRSLVKVYCRDMESREIDLTDVCSANLRLNGKQWALIGWGTMDLVWFLDSTLWMIITAKFIPWWWKHNKASLSTSDSRGNMWERCWDLRRREGSGVDGATEFTL